MVISGVATRVEAPRRKDPWVRTAGRPGYIGSAWAILSRALNRNFSSTHLHDRVLWRNQPKPDDVDDSGDLGLVAGESGAFAIGHSVLAPRLGGRGVVDPQLRCLQARRLSTSLGRSIPRGEAR